MHVNRPIGREIHQFPEALNATEHALSMRELMAVVKRRLVLIMIATLGLMALATTYVLVRDPIYQATSSVLIYNTKFAMGRNDAVLADSQLDTTFVETQLQILTSGKVANQVVTALGLEDQLPADALKPGAGPNERRLMALKHFQRNLSVDRVGLSYVLSVSYRSADPKQAATVANEIVKAFQAELAAVRLDAASASSAWMQDRIRDIGPQAKVISPAVPPIDKSNLRGILLIAIAGLLGGVITTGLAFGEVMLFNEPRTPAQIAVASGSEYFGSIPRLSHPSPGTDGDGGEATAEPGAASGLGNGDPLLSAAISAPMSPTWVTLRNAQLLLESIRPAARTCRLGVTSLKSGEGKSLVAANLARLMAEGGKQRVLLVDANPYSSALSRTFTPDEPHGFMDAVADATHPTKVIADTLSGLHFLPIGAPQNSSYPILWSAATDRFLKERSADYDYIIFDLPAMEPTTDVLAAAPYLDQILLVLSPESASGSDMAVALETRPLVRRKLVGSVVNRA